MPRRACCSQRKRGGRRRCVPGRSSLPFPSSLPAGQREVRGVPAAALEIPSTHRIGPRVFGAPEPRVLGLVALRLRTAIRLRRGVDPRLGTQDTSALRTDVSCQQEWSNVEPNAVVQIRVPTHRLLVQRLPANEDVERGFSFKDGDQLGLKFLGCSQPLPDVRQPPVCPPRQPPSDRESSRRDRYR